MGPTAAICRGAVLLGLWRAAVCVSLSVSVPDRVAALSGSCAVIPCSFRAEPHRRYQLRLRYESRLLILRGTAFCSEDASQVSRDYRGRTALAGDPQTGDCSVSVERVAADDRRRYEVWLRERGATEWKKSGKVFLDVSETPEAPLITDPGAVIEGQLVTLNCTVSSSCPSRPPEVLWKWERGVPESQSVTQSSGTPLSQGEGQILSSLSFIASSASKPRVRCEARYPGGRTASVAKEMHVRYKPTIFPWSVCHWEDGAVSCHCAVEGNPRPAVTWSVNGSSPPVRYNTSVSMENGTLSATLRGGTDQQLRVVCYAYNALGNDTSALPYTVIDSLMWKVVPAVCVLSSISLLFLLLLVFHCWRRKSGKHILNCRPSSSVYPGNLGIYQEIMPLYINCTEVTHIYTNGSYQLIYQNCTPLFVKSKQVLQVHQKERRVGRMDRQRQRERGRPERDTETPVYLEII
ncbi:sialic acid-binding Ig-like lectin 7 isoform X2 [Conger conger]|uniref:sialic acid-binding Ig-like lectin 7 isoform X2 n=1 Tax=Conger conger TaxID=82655 RepID=UPI002A5AC27A|nr:sialic acid-binding Ig-like lectin 7 isoform X2 [Conger conger]